MRRVILGTFLSLSLLGRCSGLAGESALEESTLLELEGRFKEAALALQQLLQDKNIDASKRKTLEFELDRLDRIRKDFPLTKEDLAAELRTSIRDFSISEFEDWIRQGRFQSRVIDGERYFMVFSVANLFWRYPELASRRNPPKDTAAFEKHLLASCREIKQAALTQQQSYVLAKKFKATMKVTAEPNVAPAGEMIRAWLPIPREYPFQKGFRFLSAFNPVVSTDLARSCIRSICLEQRTETNRATVFEIAYEYSAEGISFDVKADRVRAANLEDPLLEPFVREAPHIVFNPAIRGLAQQLAGTERNPYLKARRFYEWISEHIQYSFALEYSTLRNISEHCLTNGYGDCGQEALLFMALCRSSDIPARWQSGWCTFPEAKSIHDWTEIYIAPYGWIPVDPYKGIFAMRYATHLSAAEKREVRDFYFGGLDQYRMIANSDHNQMLNPPKRALRSDDVDFQRGELEWGENNIYLDKYSYELNVEELKPGGRSVD